MIRRKCRDGNLLHLALVPFGCWSETWSVGSTDQPAAVVGEFGGRGEPRDHPSARPRCQRPLAGKHLVRLVLNGSRVVGEERLLADLNARIRSVNEGPDGALYVMTDGMGGKILRLKKG